MNVNDDYEIKAVLRRPKKVDEQEKDKEEELNDEFSLSRKYSKTWSMPQE
tara:strand:+ start:3274 stop:3423 length:150 start_codon:yes stop_codon:yes gene_type:complete